MRTSERLFASFLTHQKGSARAAWARGETIEESRIKKNKLAIGRSKIYWFLPLCWRSAEKPLCQQSWHLPFQGRKIFKRVWYIRIHVTQWQRSPTPLNNNLSPGPRLGHSDKPYSRSLPRILIVQSAFLCMKFLSLIPVWSGLYWR